MLVFTQATNEDILRIPRQFLQDDPQAIEVGFDAFRRGVVPLDGLSRAVRDGEACLGAYGIIEMWPGVGRIWGFFSEPLVREHPHVLALHAKRDLQLAVDLGFDRVEASCHTQHPAAVRFLEWLGFEYEGLMRRYSPSGDDNYLYARIRNDSTPEH